MNCSFSELARVSRQGFRPPSPNTTAGRVALCRQTPRCANSGGLFFRARQEMDSSRETTHRLGKCVAVRPPRAHNPGNQGKPVRFRPCSPIFPHPCVTWIALKYPSVRVGAEADEADRGDFRPAVGLKQGRLYHWFCRATCKQAVAPDGTCGNSVHPSYGILALALLFWSRVCCPGKSRHAQFSLRMNHLDQLFAVCPPLKIQHPTPGIVRPGRVCAMRVRGNSFCRLAKGVTPGERQDRVSHSQPAFLLSTKNP